jgi:hypothetical protein
MPITADIQRLESERLRPVPHDPDRLGELFRQVLDLISAECRRAGMLPGMTPADRERYRADAAARGIRIPCPDEPVPEPVGADRDPEGYEDD